MDKHSILETTVKEDKANASIQPPPELLSALRTVLDNITGDKLVRLRKAVKIATA
jgi:hypothetical protein